MTTREIKFREWNIEEQKMYLNTKDNQYIYGDVNGCIETADILMQYTGLKDKNGKEIYEGDIVNDSYYGNSIVRWEEDLGSCGCCYDKFLGVGFVVDGDEVVGNIYENPELLK